MKIFLSYFKNRINLQTILSQWIISYITVLLLPLLIVSFYYVHTYKVIKETSEDNQRLILNNVKEQLDYVFYDSITISNELLLNSYVHSLSFDNNTYTGSSALKRHNLSKELVSFRASNQLVKDVFLYFPAMDYIVTSKSSHPASLLADMDNPSVFLDDLLSLRQILLEQRIICFQSGASSSLFLAQPLFINTKDEILSVALIQLNKETLCDRLENNLPFDNQSTFALLNNQGILLSVGQNNLIDQDLANISWNCYLANGQTALFNQEFSHKAQTYVLNYKPSLLQNCFLISLTEKCIYHVNTYKLLEKLIISLILCLLLGLTVTFYYSRKNYQPISQIMNYINSKTDNRHTQNEYQIIAQFLKQNQNELEHQRNLLRNHYLINVLNGNAPTAQLALSSPYSCVVGLQLKAISEDIKLLTFIIQNILDELFASCFPEHYYCTLYPRDLFVLINLPVSKDNSENYLVEITQIIQKLQDFLSTNYAIDFIAGIGNIHLNNTIYDSRMEAESVLEYLRLFEPNSIMTYNDIPSDSTITNLHLNTGDYVQNLLKTGSSEQLDNYFSQIYTELKSRNLSTQDAKTCLYFFHLTTRQLAHFCQLHYGIIPASLEFATNDTIFSALSLQQSLEKIQASYQNFIKEYAILQTTFETKHWGTNICRYIESNYFDANLNLNSVAEHFSLTPAYLSRKFKEHFNKSVNDYLYEIRIVHAKQLMTDTNLPLIEIAQMTGFIDSSAFIRIFKKYVGITPGKYRASSTLSS